MEESNKQAENKPCTIHDVIERFSGENLMKLQKHFVSLYGSDEMAKEKANSFSTGLACMELERDFIGIEIDEEIFNSAKKRVEEKRKENIILKENLRKLGVGLL